MSSIQSARRNLTQGRVDKGKRWGVAANWRSRGRI